MALNEHLSPRERVMCTLGHDVPDRTPLFIKAEKEVWPMLRQHLGVADNEGVMRRLGIDVRTVAPRYVGPQREVFLDGSFIDVLGHHRKVVEHQFGTYLEYAGFPLAEYKSVDDLAAYPWPKADWWEVDHIPDEIERLNQDTEYAILYEAGSVLETGWGLRGLDTFLMDMAINPDMAQFIMERWADFWIELGRKVLEAGDGRIDIAWTWDDIGTQNGPMISPRMWEQQIKPHHVRMNKALKEHDVTLMYHSCGSIMPFIDGLIDMGVEILNPLQPRAKGMDLPYVKATYGDQLAFHGAMDIQKTLPHGTTEDVAAEVRDRIQVLGAGGGYILAPAHMMQGDTPVENIVTMYDTARSTPVPPKPSKHT
jgi:uroporphyrinogen decarboxylase